MTWLVVDAKGCCLGCVSFEEDGLFHASAYYPPSAPPMPVCVAEEDRDAAIAELAHLWVLPVTWHTRADWPRRHRLPQTS
jgi:hypothetical protein